MANLSGCHLRTSGATHITDTEVALVPQSVRYVLNCLTNPERSKPNCQVPDQLSKNHPPNMPLRKVTYTYDGASAFLQNEIQTVVVHG